MPVVRLSRKTDDAAAWAYLAPALVLFAFFTFWPFLRAIELSLFLVDRNNFEPAKWFGLGYYERIFNLGETALGDEWVRSIATTFQFTLMVVPLTLTGALGLALLAATKIKGIGVYRTIFTSSLAISLASAAVIWSLIYSPNLKFFDHVLTDKHSALWAEIGRAHV